MPAPSARRFNRRHFLQRAGYLGLGVLVWIACGGGEEKRRATTLERTIQRDAEGNLVYGSGEPYVVRTELAQAQTGREGRRRSVVVFHHLSDFRILDEESPLRAEWSDECDPPPSTEAFRPQETLSVQAAEALIGAANGVHESPATGHPVDFAIHTGNAANSAQFNELRWFLDMMDGKPVYPDAGAIGYQGVQGESPAAAYPDLLETAQRPFTPEGIAYPWYAVAGNRDVLVEGNFAPGDRSRQFVTGAQKIMRLGPDALEEACSSADNLLGPGSSSVIFNDPETIIRGVGSDANRRLLSLKEWMAEHFGTAERPGPDGHGFSAAGVDGGTAYYAFEQAGVVFLVLNTVNPAGFSAGSIDAAQFKWLEEQLIAHSGIYLNSAGQQVTTANPDRLIVIVSHHPSDAMTNPFPGPGGDQRLRGEHLEALLHRFPNVIMHIAGHTLLHRIAAKPDPTDPTRAYVQVTTGAPADSPMQGRLIEITDNRDGTISILSTVYDSLAPINPGDADDPTPDDGLNQRLLAGVARQLADGDPQADLEAGGLQPSDRNAELVIEAPFDLATLPRLTPQPDQ